MESSDDDNDITRPQKKQKGQLSNYTVYTGICSNVP